MTPDTAPEAITQAREAVARQGYSEAHAMLRDLFTADKISDTMIRVVRDHMMQFRRLTSHSAGEGLREALEPVLHWYQSDEHPERLTADIVRDVVADLQEDRAAVLAARSGGIDVAALAEAFCATPLPAGVAADLCATDAGYEHPRFGTHLLTVGQAEQMFRTILTPPSDAGSTTRSGGEGVGSDHRAHLAFDRWADRHPDAPAYWFRLPSWVQEYATECVRQTERRLATTPSPDASPDSGGALARAKARQVARDASGAVHVDGSIYEGMEASLQRGGRTIAHVGRYADAVEIAAAMNPSPSPAIVKEAGEVEVAAEDNARADAWADFRDQYLEDGNDGYVAAPAYERARTAFDEGWAGGRAPAFSHARAALSASNAAQVSK